MNRYISKGSLNPRLAKIMAKLARVIQEEDLMASVIISDGESSEYFCPVDAEWSAVRLRNTQDGGKAVQIREAVQGEIDRTVKGLALLFKQIDHHRGNLAVVMDTLRKEVQMRGTEKFVSQHTPKPPLPPDQQPKNLIEAAVRLMGELDSDQKMWVLQKPLYEALPEVHHGFGTDLRNSWNLWADDCPLKKHVQQTYKLFGHADDLSTLIFTALWAVIRGTDPHPDIEAEVMGMKAHWREQGINPETGEKGLVL